MNIHPQIWQTNTPETSANAHLFFKAIQLLEHKKEISNAQQPQLNGKSLLAKFLWRTRIAFFENAVNIANLDELFNIADQLTLPTDKIQSYLSDGSAMSLLCRDIELKEIYAIEGSPSYVLNEGRQKLYGNIGFNIIEANVLEIIDQPDNQASWC